MSADKYAALRAALGHEPQRHEGASIDVRLDAIRDHRDWLALVHAEAHPRLLRALLREQNDLLDLLQRALAYVEDCEDVDDGPDGEQVANHAMELAMQIREALGEDS